MMKGVLDGLVVMEGGVWVREGSVSEFRGVAQLCIPSDWLSLKRGTIWSTGLYQYAIIKEFCDFLLKGVHIVFTDFCHPCGVWLAGLYFGGCFGWKREGGARRN